ncbi:MAG: N4-gp56 family major capsid protein [Actinomycetales bacterium]|nr:N4-gp56 family major capsid protein [Actinomycetales bacterium]
MPAGTGTPGANQNGPATSPMFSPGEIVTAAGPLSINAPAPVVDITLGGQFVTKAYDLAVYPSLRPELIFDQFATVRASNTTHRGGSVRFSFIDDIAEQTTPLLENIDVDSVTLSSKALTVTMREYGTAVTNTALLRGTSMISLDPVIAERVGYNAGLSVDTLARVALDQTTVTYDDASTASVGSIGNLAGPLTGTHLRNGVAILRARNVRPLRGGNYVAVLSPYQAQHLMSEVTDTGWRWMVGYAGGEGTAGNSVFQGEVGTYEGVRIVVNNHLTDLGRGYLMGAEALAKAYSTAPGFGPDPKTVVAPVVDKLKRFASIGWYHLVGYSIFRADALLQIRTQSTLV